MRPLTGPKVFAGFALAFGIIIAVNLTLAFNAVNTFPGLETKNSYVVSQNFNRDRLAQEALGWTVKPELEGDQLTLNFVESDGDLAKVESLKAIIGRATHVRDDVEPHFVRDGRSFVTRVELGPGNWNIRLIATAPDGTVFRQRVPVYIRG